MWENVPSAIEDSNQSAQPCSLIKGFVVRMKKKTTQKNPHKTLHPWLSKMCRVKILIRLLECAGLSESSLCASVRRYVFWRFGSFLNTNLLVVFANLWTFVRVCESLVIGNAMASSTQLKLLLLHTSFTYMYKRIHVYVYMNEYFTWFADTSQIYVHSQWARFILH